MHGQEGMITHRFVQPAGAIGVSECPGVHRLVGMRPTAGRSRAHLRMASL